MKTTTEYNAKGGFRFLHHEPLPVGKYFLHLGEKVKLIGPGMAGMPEVESEDGSTNYAFPHDLTPCDDASVHSAGTQRPGSPDVSLATETRKPGSLK
jgi:hypothetical protein